MAASAQASREFHCSVEAVQGTSFATPLVAGAAVLLRQWFMKGNYGSGSFVPSGALLKAMLIHSGQAMSTVLRQDGSLRNTDFGDYTQGYGRVQLDRVLSANTSTTGSAGTAPLSLFVVGAADPTSSHYASMSVTGEQHSYEFSVGSSEEPLKFTLGKSLTICCHVCYCF
jgi:hypothetical protein